VAGLAVTILAHVRQLIMGEFTEALRLDHEAFIPTTPLDQTQSN